MVRHCNKCCSEHTESKATTGKEFTVYWERWMDRNNYKTGKWKIQVFSALEKGKE